MAKRMLKAEAQLMTWVIIIGLPIYGITQLGESVGWELLIILVLAIIVLAIFYKFAQKKKRKKQLMKKYQDKKLVNKLMKCLFWQGQTSEQLMDSIGQKSDLAKTNISLTCLLVNEMFVLARSDF